MDRALLLVIALVLVAVVIAVVITVTARKKPQLPVGEPLGTELKRTGGLGQALRRVWGSDALDSSTWNRLEEVLLASDLGAEATDRVVTKVKDRSPGTVEEARALLAEALLGEFGRGERDLDLSANPTVILVVGVNGSGKTTTIAKLAKRLTDHGKSVVLAGADTFRAAAGEQLRIWGDRVGIQTVTGGDGADPASVAHDAISSAQAKGTEVVIVDTAGRLHSRKDLMDELGKIHRVASAGATVGEVLLVLDASGGQNGVVQAREFANAVPLTGVVLTKLDGTAKGGVVVSVEGQLGVPVKLVGTGEGVADLESFDPERFVANLLAG